jgi:adenylate kinase family enzyme
MVTRRPLQAFHDQTTPVLEHYKPWGIVRVVNADQDINRVTEDIFAALNKFLG